VRISAAEYNYYYLTTIQNFQNNYGQYLSYFGLDLTKPLSTQKYSDELTWEQYFEQQAMNSLRSVVVMSEEAKKNNVSLTENDQHQIDEFINGVTTSAKDPNKSLPLVFGKGTTVENLRKTRERFQLAQRYILDKVASYQVTDADIEARYNANKSSYDKLDYNYFDFAVSTEGQDEDQVKKAKEEALAKANDMLKRVQSGENFRAVAKEFAPEAEKANYDTENATLALAADSSSIPDEALSKWLFDDTRKKGDAGVVETTNGYSVLLFDSRYRDEYNTRSVRHILIPTKQSADGTVTDEENAKAKAKAEDILAKFRASNNNLDEFAKLCAINSDDTATAANGGLYENVQKGVMVPEFENWVFDAGRKPGDAAVVATEYGYHVMYYVGENLPVWKFKVKDDIVNEKYDADYAALEANYDAKFSTLGMSITK
jgi:hypothetical protein